MMCSTHPCYALIQMILYQDSTLSPHLQSKSRMGQERRMDSTINRVLKEYLTLDGTTGTLNIKSSGRASLLSLVNSTELRSLNTYQMSLAAFTTHIQTSRNPSHKASESHKTSQIKRLIQGLQQGNDHQQHGGVLDKGIGLEGPRLSRGGFVMGSSAPKISRLELKSSRPPTTFPSSFFSLRSSSIQRIAQQFFITLCVSLSP